MAATPDDLDLVPTIRKAFRAVAKSFAKDELAYLALTSKVESPIRDRLAFALHSMLGESGFIVAREWQRIDLAVFRGPEPVALVEIKATYTFDGFTPEYQDALRDDYTKCRRKGITGGQIFTLLVATHPHGEPTVAAEGVIKYAHKIRRSLAKYGSHEAVAKANAAKIESWRRAEVLDQGRLNGGEAFGVPVSVYYWLFGPRPRQENK